jgi:hypothetical protein
VIVILDSNAIIGDYWLRSRGLERLLGQAELGEIQLIVPDVVMLEVVKHFRSDMDGVAAELKRADDRAGRMIRDFEPRPALELEGSVATYHQFLRTRLERAGAIFETPQVALEEIARRAVERHAPFKSSGAGYQDTLIWELVKEKAVGDNVALISSNHKDFGGDSDAGGLHWFLEDELEGAAHAGHVERYATVSRFNREHLEHSGVYGAELVQKLDDPEYGEAAKLAVAEALEGTVSGGGAVAEPSNTSVLSATVEELRLEDVYDGGHGPYASFDAVGTAEIEFPMLQSEAWIDYEDGLLEGFTVDDDEYVGEAVKKIEFELTAEAEYKPDTGDLSEWEITWITTKGIERLPRYVD